MQEEHNKTGFRSVDTLITDQAFEKGVKDGYVQHCNLSFINAQWKGHELLSISV